jgi:amino acid adenylation domain-containing protein
MARFRAAFVFSGIGTQWAGMAAALRQAGTALPGALEALEQVEHEFAAQAGQSVMSILDGGSESLARPSAAHAAIFAVQAALLAGLRGRGICADAALGHSSGEVGAALCAGVLDLSQAVRLIIAHCALIDASPPGAMLHIDIHPDELPGWLARAGIDPARNDIALAVHNAERAIVVAGPPAPVDRLMRVLAADGIGHRRLRIDIPFHSAGIDAQLPVFRKTLAGLVPHPARLPIYSALRGSHAVAGDFDADYWARHIRQPTRFHGAVKAAVADGITHFIEIGPHPVLLAHLAAVTGTGFTGRETLHRETGARSLIEWLAQDGARPSVRPPSEAADTARLLALIGRLLAGRTGHVEAGSEARPGASPEPRTEEAITTEAAPELPADWPERGWGDLGLSSSKLVGFGARLGAAIGKPLPPTLAYRCPTPALLARHLALHDTKGGDATPIERPAPAAPLASGHDPVAVVGLACRLPGGANTPAAFWDLLASGRDAVGEVPPDRWSIEDWYSAQPRTPGKSISRWGGFIAGHDLRTFDDRLFRITPREARALDPQQRLLLEVSWEALENAGIPPLSLRGERVAVYTGMSTDDYKTATLYHGDPRTLDAYGAAGAMACTAGGRLSYYFGWQGANITIDTACSSSLVALDLAVQALRDGRCDLAVVAGVNALLTPHLYVYFSQVGALSPTGRCHTFDASADGYVRAEGCGVLVLERASRARAAGRRPRALIAGTAVNQDGASPGFSAPNGAAQTDVIEAAWRAAGARAEDIAYVEAHGTGTPLGDPIELESLAAALHGRRLDDPLPVGSVKSQIGHTEAVAGIAGAIKLVLSLEHDALPGNLHFQSPNPAIPWSRLPLRVVDRLQPWPARGERRLAGVSSFGFSGTNAHAVIEAVPAVESREHLPAGRCYPVLLLSGPDDAPLHELAARTATALARCADDESRADLVWSSNTGRQSFGRRLAIAAPDWMQLQAAAAAWAGGQPVAAPARALIGLGEPGQLVFAFTGQGCQHPGMARDLHAAEPVFREVIERCDAAFTALRGRSMLPYLLDPDADDPGWDGIELAQPAIFMMQCALAALWASRGIRPGHVIGHSAGEIAAGVCAGALTLEEGLSLIEARSRLMAEHPPHGIMVSIPVDEATAIAAISAEGSGSVHLAGVNAADSVVLSGDGDAIDRITARLDLPKGTVRRLRISNAFHTPLLAPSAEALARHCRGLLTDASRAPAARWLSSMDGRDLTAVGAGPDYWAAQLQAPVRFDSLLSTLESDGATLFVEIGPAAVLTALGTARPATAAGKANWIASQQRKVDGRLALTAALAGLAAAGHRIDWSAWQGARQAHRVDLPPYPFQRRHHWIEAAVDAPAPIELPAPSSTPQQADTMPNDTDLKVARQTVCDLIAEITGFSAAELDPDTPLLDLGMDSLMLMQLRGLLENRHGLALKIAELYEGCDTAALIAARLPAPASSSPAQPVVVTASPVPSIPPAIDGPASTPVAPQPAAPAPAASLHVQAPAPAVPAAFPARTPVAIGTLAGQGLEGLMAMQIQALSQLMSEQLAVLGGQPALRPAMAESPLALAPAPAPHGSVSAPTPAPPPGPSATPASTSAPTTVAKPPPKTPNFRSLTLAPDTFAPAQQTFVDALTQRYVARTRGSRELAERHRGPLADWKNTLSYRHSLKEMTYPIAAVRSKGAWFTDVDGNEFLDITMGCGIAVLGHSPDEVVERVVEQTRNHFAIGPQTPLAAAVAERFCRLTGMERVTFCNTGAEAVMMAARIARAVTGRRKIAIFAGAYHGTWDGVLGVEHEGHVFPIGDGIPPGMVEDLVILNYGTDEALAALEACAHELAAVLVEPVQSRRPGLQPVEFLRSLRRITERSGSALIFDEMITGFRIAPGGAQAHFGIRADLATYGKIAGGGLPLSAVAGSARFLDRVDGGPWQYGDDSAPLGELIYFGGTYVKHPLALAAADAALERIEALGEPGYAALNARSEDLAERLNDWFAAERVPLQMANFGSLFRIDGTGRYSAMMQPIELDLFFFLLLLRGLYVWERRVLFLSMAHGDAEIDRIVAAVKEAVAELRAGGFEFRTPGAAPGKSEGRRDSSVAPASFAQRRLYALECLDGQSTVYNVPLALALDGPLDVARLRRCFERLVRRHEALRTRFAIDGDAVVQEILPPESVTLDFELRDCPQAAFVAEAEAAIQPFDLARAPLLRVRLLRDGAGQHALLMDAHHIVVDGLSLNIIARELMALYAGKPLPPLAARPLEAVAAQAARLDSPAGREDAQWWQARFAELPPLLSLPTDRPRPQRRRHRGADVLAELDETGTSALKAAARSRRLTVFGLALGAFGALLHRLCGQDDIVVGLPVGGREDPRFADLIGMFANTLPLRIRPQAEAPLGDFARDCQREFLACLEHQDSPLEALIGSLRLPRDLARNPLFDTMFIFEDANDRIYRMPGLECRSLPVSRHASMFDLAMEVIESGGKLELRLEYDTDLFEAETARQILDSYRHLLAQAAEALERPLSALELVSAEQHANLKRLADGGPLPDAPATVCAQFLRQLAERPEAPALQFADTTLSYRQLGRQAAQIASALAPLLAPATANGAQPLVAVLCERSVELPAALLAVLHLGAAYLPIDPEFPAQRIAHMLEDSGCAALLVSESCAGNPSLPDSIPRLLLPLPGLAPAQAAVAGQPDLADPPAPLDSLALPEPDALAYLIYTSGSTGTPKGTGLRHRNVAALFATLPDSFGFAPGQRILAVTTVSFDIAAVELLGALCCGMTVVLADTAQARDPALTGRLIALQRVDVAQLTPTRLRLLLDHAPGSLTGLRTLVIGGEALPPDLAQRVLAAFPGLRCINAYGPTETAIWSACALLEPALLGAPGAPVPIGRALPGERIHLLSESLALQPPGAIGEIAIAGAGVALGYHKRPELNAERFPLLPEIESEPLYLTGDLGRWRADGQLEYLGRRDHQFKLRGVRIEAAEIEHALRQLPEIRDATVGLHPDHAGEPCLIAWLATDARPDAPGWRAALSRSLPAAMLPEHFVCLPTLPQTPNGKLDRKTLPVPPILGNTAAADAGPAPSHSPRVAAILRAFDTVVPTHAFGPLDDFFVAGGDSIRALRVVALLREAGYLLELESLFQAPTPVALAPLLDLAPAVGADTARDADDDAPSFTGMAADELDNLFN